MPPSSWRRASRPGGARRSRYGLLDRAGQLVPHGDERVDRLVPHFRLRLMLAELCPLEERREATDGIGARLETLERALDVLERRLGGMARKPCATECALHPRVRGYDRTSEIGVVAQIVDRFVDRERHLL